MTEPKFTPGPWKLKDTAVRVDVWADNFFLVASTASRSDAAKANARLIAAAPEMYELLNQFRQYIAEGPLGTRGEMYKRIDALLAKARGEENQ